MQIILLRLYLKNTHKVKFYPGRRNFTQASVLVIFVTNIICFHFICVILCTQCIFCTVCNFMLLAFYAVSSKKLVCHDSRAFAWKIVPWRKITTISYYAKNQNNMELCRGGFIFGGFSQWCDHQKGYVARKRVVLTGLRQCHELCFFLWDGGAAEL